MNLQELKISLEFIKKTSSDELVNNHLKMVFDTYYKIFGEVCTGCPTKIAGYIFKLKKHDKNLIMSKDTRVFRLKKGAIIPIAGTSKAYSDVNITDEIAIEILKANPNRRSIFLKVPENLEELLKEETQEDSDEVVKIGDKELSIEEALKVLKSNDIKTKATTVTGVQKVVDTAIKDGKEIVLKDDSETLIGSTKQPALFNLKDDSVITLGDVVAKAHELSELSIEDWNKLEEEDLEARIQFVVDALELKED